MSEQIKKIRQLIAAGKEYKALDALEVLLKAEKQGKGFLNNLFLLQSRLEGVESNFNQGILTYEDWKVSRNKILVSLLAFLDQVDAGLSLDESAVQIDLEEKGKIRAPVATYNGWRERVANPTFVRRMAFYYVILWVFLGALDTLVFRVEDPNLVATYSLFGIEFNRYMASGSVVSWLKDFVGHLFAFGTAALTIVLEIVKSNLGRTSTLVWKEVNDLYRKYFFVFLLLIFVLIAAAVFFNTRYTTVQSSIQLWSVTISPRFFPPFIAANYFLLVVLPLLLALFHYGLLLQVTIKYFKSYPAYSPFHGDQSFGLLPVGRSIFWGTLSFMGLMLLALILQLSLKNGELTFGVFLAAFFFFVLVWFGGINPLQKLSAKLQEEKERLYDSIKEEVRSNNRMLLNQSNLEDLNTVKLLLDASRANEEQLLKLRVLPLPQNELWIGGAILLFFLGMIIYQIS